MKPNPRIAVIGFGMVGKEMVRILKARKFPFESLRVFARSERTEILDGCTYNVETLADEEVFEGIDLALFAGTEGEKGASSTWGWKAVEKGTVVIDNGNDFRMDSRVPLVVPEVNPNDIESHQGFIANPNCSTIQMVATLAPLHRSFQLTRVMVSTYQAVSGSGTAAVRELEDQVVHPENRSAGNVYPHPIFSNVIPEIGSESTEFPGYTSEEVKMILETRKILHLPELEVSATCARVPVMNGHSESIHAEFQNTVEIEKVVDVLSRAKGVIVENDLCSHVYPLALHASGLDPVFVGRIRRCPGRDNAIELWCTADNIRKGAALNAVQIAEYLVRKK